MASPSDPVPLPTADGPTSGAAVNGPPDGNHTPSTAYKPKKASLINRIINKLKAVLKERKKKTTVGSVGTGGIVIPDKSSAQPPAPTQAPAVVGPQH